MKKNFSKIVLVLFCALCIGSVVQAQEVLISGQVVDSQTKQPIEFATVMVGDPATEAPLSGTTTALDGTFSLKTTAEKFFIEVSFIGFTKKHIEDFSIENGKVNLGIVTLAEDRELLDEVVVQGERSQTEFKLDKRVFNVGKDLSSTGASALEVLNNVPSVNVNIEGEISLRGSSGVQILINGKPSVIASEQGNALGTITADMIESIEVITNPSAKYEAEGSSGILNIILKKEERKGMNGAISVNTGVPHNHSVGISLNKRTEKLNLFSQFGVGYRELPNDLENINRDLNTNTAVASQGEEFRNEQFYNVVLGTDYYINDRNVITLSGNFAYEIEDQPSQNNFQFIEADGTVSSEWQRSEVTSATNPKYQYELQYKRDFKDHKDHTLLFSALGNFFGKSQSSEFTNQSISGENRDSQQQTETDFQEARYTFNLDYTKPYSEKITLETGFQYVLNDVGNDFSVSNLIDGVWVEDASLTNDFNWQQNVLGVYATGAYEGERWGIKLGLRVENTDLETLLATTDERNSQNFTNLFPSVHTSFKLSDNYSIQGGYSRRIFRPRLWDLNPFFNIRNDFNVRTGNPNLQPMFTDSYEIAAIYDLDQLSFNFGLYHRYTTDVVERISTLENNVNITRPINIGVNRETGIEINGKYTPNDWFTLNGDFNFNYFQREGSLEGTSFDFNADQWSTKLNAKFKLPAKIDFEVTGHYRSRFQTVQSIVSDNLFADLGFRKKIMNGKGVINMSVRDIFASRFRESETNQPTFYAYNFRQRGRFITFGFSYGFGKGEAMEYSGQRRRF